MSIITSSALSLRRSLRHIGLIVGGLAVTTLPAPAAGAGGARDALVYRDGGTISVFRRHAEMLGFRFRGQYSRAAGPTLALPGPTHASLQEDLGAEVKARPDSWYAIFAVANPGDTSARLLLMPFLKLGGRTRDGFLLVDAGERLRPSPSFTGHAWRGSGPRDSDALIVSEAGRFSGRVTRISAAAPDRIGLAEPGAATEGDFILPAPPGYRHYVYLGSFYYEPFEIRNIFDSGTIVKAKMTSLRPAGVVSGTASNVELDFAGRIPPLATAVLVESGGGLSTNAVGQYSELFAGDESGHVLETRQITKTAPGTLPVHFSALTLPFSRFQKIFYSNAGSLARAHAEGTIEIVGWIEP